MREPLQAIGLGLAIWLGVSVAAVAAWVGFSVIAPGMLQLLLRRLLWPRSSTPTDGDSNDGEHLRIVPLDQGAANEKAGSGWVGSRPGRASARAGRERSGVA